MVWQIVIIVSTLISASVGLWWINDGWRKRTTILLEDIAKRKSNEDDMALRLKQLNIMRQVSEELSDRLSMDSLLNIALDAAMRLSDAHAGFIYIQNPPYGGFLKTVGKYTALTELRQHLQLVDLTHFSAQLHACVDDKIYSIPHLPDTKAQMIIPLQSQDKIIGILNLETASTNRFTEDRFQFMQILAGQIGVALDNGRLFTQAQHQVVELQMLYAKLSELEHLKTDMIRLAAHDLRNPLSVLMSYIQLLEQDQDKFEPQYHSYFKTMANVINRIYNIINEILSLERIEQIAIQQKQEPIQLATLIQDAIVECDHQIQSKNQKVLIDIDESVEPILGDRAQIHEAIINLLSNAVKYTPTSGKIIIHLDQQQDDAVLTITDTGIGIPEDQQPHLFKPFFRLQDPTNPQIEGTGLGLSLVRNIIERHRGEIIFKSKYGEGSTFGFKLPCDKKSSDDLPTSA